VVHWSFVQALGAYSTVAVTLGLVVARPRIGARFRVTPAMAALAGVAVLVLMGAVHASDIAGAARTMWRPLLGVVAIMVMAAVARDLGVLDALAALTLGRSRDSAPRLFTKVFFMSAAIAAVLNNDSAILLLTPLVVTLVRKRYPTLVVPFAFAVFMAAGVAPTVVSNPMNLVVATYANIGFNEYAARMIPVALAGCFVTFGVLRLVFHRALVTAPPAPSESGERRPLDRRQWAALAVLGAIVGSYPIASYFGAPVWAVACAGAVPLLALAAATRAESAGRILRREVHWDVLLFLVAVFVLSIGLRNVGFVDHLASAYAGAGVVRVGGVSALGSAIINNHPMGLLNMMALERADHANVLAALVGGDLGPRLFPIGSLAGLLWLEMLRREKVEVPVSRFVLVGVLVTLPSLLVCLALLAI
jgi:arsenical pump membrane protein